MANVLQIDKKIAVIGALAEGNSIRSIERMTGIHRDTIMRLGVSVGQGCTALMDRTMRNLDCTRLEMDEIWGFVGKKDRHIKDSDDPTLGNVWTFCAIDADTKLVPAFRVGNRDAATANAFVADVADRLRNRVQISTDGLKAHPRFQQEAGELRGGGRAALRLLQLRAPSQHPALHSSEGGGCSAYFLDGWRLSGGDCMSYIEDLKTVIHHLHGAEATHRESVPVKEVWNGQTIWDGIVEVFTLHDHPEANTAYAWSHETDDPAQPQQHVTVLHVAPVVSPITAVRAAIAAEFRANATA